MLGDVAAYKGGFACCTLTAVAAGAGLIIYRCIRAIRRRFQIIGGCDFFGVGMYMCLDLKLSRSILQRAACISATFPHWIWLRFTALSSKHRSIYFRWMTNCP